MKGFHPSQASQVQSSFGNEHSRPRPPNAPPPLVRDCYWGLRIYRTIIPFSKKEKNRPNCKPGSVTAMNAAPAIYPHAVSPRRCIVLPSGVCACTGGKATRTSSPYDAGIHELSASDVHSPHVTMRLVSSCLTFSPLPPCLPAIPAPRDKEARRPREGGGLLLH